MIADSFQRAAHASRRLVGWLVVAGIVVYGLSGIYSVKPNEVAVHQRFGKVLDPRVPSGIHYALPWPVDRVDKVPVRSVQRLAIDDFQPGDDPNTAAGLFRIMTQLESFCVTGDNNVVNIGCAVQYMVSDPAAFLFRPGAPQAIMRAVACNSTLHCLAGMTVDQALTLGSQQIKDFIHQEMNRQLSALGVGLAVVAVDLQPVRPPQAVQSYFDDVVNAKIDKRKLVHQAEANQNERFARARVEATRITQEALAAKVTAVARAQGDASRFLQRLSEYKKTPTVTRRRLWLEFVRDVLGKVQRKYVADGDRGGPTAHMRIVTPP
jgi:membrane protease subunit HflK